MRSKNIFIRKETAFSCLNGKGNTLPTFACVTGYTGGDKPEGDVLYIVDYLAGNRKDPYWHYSDNDNVSGTYILPLDKFLSRFEPDYDDVYSQFVR